MNDRILLSVYGLTYSQLQSGAFALLLQQVDGPYRIPVVIGAAEAQSIAIALEGVQIPRPMTHDLFQSFTQAFGIRLVEVMIYKFEDGIFYSELTFTDDTRTIKIDARTSDAIAIAMRTNSPIYTTPEIIAETGFAVEENENDVQEKTPAESQPKLENYSIEQLEITLNQMIDEERYEEAAKVQALIDKKRGQS